MQFLAQIALDGLGGPTGQAGSTAAWVMAIFMCQNDPGMCDEWSPTLGGNLALLFPRDDLQPILLPHQDDEGTLRLGDVNTVQLVPEPAADYGSAREAWGNRPGNDLRNVLGQLGGQAHWLQDDETPACPRCSRAMDLIAQLEEGPDHSTAMNFGGGGAAFAFACHPCARAAFLWQC